MTPVCALSIQRALSYHIPLYHIGNSLSRVSFLVPRARLELAATILVGKGSIQLNYRGTV